MTYPAHGHRELTPVKQRQHTSDEFAQHPRWASQQQLSQAPNSSLVANDGASQGYEFALNQFWAKQPGLDQIAGWDYDAQRVAPELSGQYHQNNHLCYDPEAALNVAATRHNSYSGQIGWMPTMVGGDIAGTCASVSEFDSISSLSPQSYFSDRVDNSFSPCSVSDQASSRGDWTTSTSPSAPIKMSSPQLGSSIPYSGYVLARNSNFRRCPDLTGLPGGGFSLAGPSLSVHANNAGHALETPFDGGHQHSADGSLVSMTAPSSSSSWYMSGHSPSRSDVKLTQPDGRAYKTEHDDNGIASSASNHSSSSHGSPSSEGSCSDLHVQVNEQACFKTSQTLDTEAQRQRNDDLLLQGKRDGLTYREIRNKMLGEKPAESTLRGRYRSLTKARKDRVRKPVWHKRDVNIVHNPLQQKHANGMLDRAT